MSAPLLRGSKVVVEYDRLEYNRARDVLDSRKWQSRGGTVFESWLDNLNPAQRQAVTHGDGPLLVIAGAGTGKTMTLASRVAFLIERGVPPDRILLLTFTRRASAEMIRRATNMTGPGHTSKIWGGTFHAMANRLLRFYGQGIGLPSDFSVLDQADAADVMNLVRSELGLAKGKRRFPKKETLVAIYSRTVAAREKLGHVLKTRFPWCKGDLDEIRTIFEQYTERKRAQNVLDYDDLLLYWNVLCTAGGIADTVADRFEHILVDEYQDTNAVQSDILRAMRRRIGNICVVGDDAQSIYSFRAATIRNILDFPEQFPATTIVKLEQNYRSTQPILAASNAVMADARERYTKDLWSKRESEQKPVLVHCVDDSSQCTLVCDNVLDHLERGTPLMRQAVLFRAGHHSDQLEVELARRNVPFHKFGGLKFIESAHVKDMLAFLRIMENPYDEISWFRVLLLLDGVGPRTARKIMDALGGRQAAPNGKVPEDGANPAEIVSPLQCLLDSPPQTAVGIRKPIAALREMLSQCYVLSPESSSGAGSMPSVAAQVECARRFYEPIFEQKYDNAAMRLRDLEQLEHIAAGYQSRRKFLTDMVLDPPSATSDLAQPPMLEEDYLILSTIHSAKGCEWDVVHIIHAADGMIPSDMAISDDAGIEEERRLFYVALTRARNVLYVYFPLRYYHRHGGLGDGHSYAQLTRFITKPVQALFEERTMPIESEDEPGSAPAHVRSLDSFLKGLWEE